MLERVFQPLVRTAFDMAEAKMFFEHSIAFGDDALHVLAGVAIQLAAAFLLRSSIDRAGPWISVVLLELLNEAIDLNYERWPVLAMQLGESGKDMMLTLALPTLLLLVARVRPELLTGGFKTSAPDRDPPESA